MMRPVPGPPVAANARQTVKDLLKILLGFLPWILFGILAGPSLFRLEMALAVALAS